MIGSWRGNRSDTDFAQWLLQWLLWVFCAFNNWWDQIYSDVWIQSPFWKKTAVFEKSSLGSKHIPAYIWTKVGECKRSNRNTWMDKMLRLKCSESESCPKLWNHLWSFFREHVPLKPKARWSAGSPAGSFSVGSLGNGSILKMVQWLLGWLRHLPRDVMSDLGCPTRCESPISGCYHDSVPVGLGGMWENHFMSCGWI